MALVAGVALINAAIDPHGVHRWIDVKGLNHIKPRATQSIEGFKFRAIDSTAARTLLLGNSRVEMGWDPNDLPEHFGSAVNAAIPGSSLSSMVELADHAWRRSSPERLIVGLEFFDCLESGPRPNPRQKEVSPWSANQPSRTFHVRRTKEMAEDLLSIDTLADTLVTVMSQRDNNASHLRNDGFQTARNFPAIVRVDGVRKMFVQREIETIRARARGPKSIRYSDGTPSICIDALHDLLAGARERDQTVLLATYPYHARLLEIIVQTGLVPAFEDWKREITIAAEKSNEVGGRVSLRSFDGYHAYAAERIGSSTTPSSGMRWYWEAGHFKASLGTRMLAVMAGSMPPEPGFGEEMRSSSIDALLSEFHRRRALFLRNQPDTAEEIAALIERHR